MTVNLVCGRDERDLDELRRMSLKTGVGFDGYHDRGAISSRVVSCRLCVDVEWWGTKYRGIASRLVITLYPSGDYPRSRDPQALEPAGMTRKRSSSPGKGEK